LVEIKKTRTMIATLNNIEPPQSKAARFLRLRGRTGSVRYSDHLKFTVLDSDGRISDGFKTSELIEEPEKEGNYIFFKTKEARYTFRELF
jgi:hypothetical protein